jgi:hypothetical protein
MWDKKGNDRLAAWRKFRYNITPLPLDKQLSETVGLWKNCHIGNNNHDFLNIDDWPGPWEHILEDSFNDFGRALGMCYTLILIDNWNLNNLKIQVYKDLKKISFYNVVNLNDTYILNYEFNKVMNISSIPESAKLLCEHDYIDLLNKFK